MRICQVISSNIPVLPTGKRRWGALELIMDEYAKHLRSMGHIVDLKYLNDINPKEYDIIHIHVANLCLMAKKMGIPYIYSNHDHTSFHYGKGSWLYNQQLEAIKGSVFSIAHGESVIDFFNETDKLSYLPHGVDTKFYTPSKENERTEGLLMIASNGMAGDYGIDRKGFRIGIEAAKELDMPITVVGSEANAEFFKIHSDLLAYNKLTVDASNPDESVKLKYYQSHKIFLHPSYLEFGSPNLTLLEAWSCGIPTVAAYDGSRKIDGMAVLKSLDVTDVCKNIEEIESNYSSYLKQFPEDKSFHDWSTITMQLEKMYSVVPKIKEVHSTNEVRNKYIEVYEKN